MNKKLAILSAALMMAGTLSAQTLLKGRVTDKDGNPIISAPIKVGKKVVAISDENGNFTLSKLPAGVKEVQVTYIGMETKTVDINGDLNVVLQESSTNLDEVMVVAFGTAKKSSFTGSAAVVSSKDLSNKVTTNVADALVGSVPGLQLRGASGQPGASQASIHIRGISSMYASTTPLIIVDGAPYSASLSNIPQDEIENVTVLKDAASAALYGARGASGVILITTKSGNKQQKARVSVEAKYGLTQRAVQDYEMFNTPGEYLEGYYTQLYNKALFKDGMTPEEANKWANGAMFDDPNVGLRYNPYTLPQGEMLIGLDGKLNPKATLGREFKHGNDTYYITPDNWQDAAYRNGMRQEYNANISGGNDRLSYYTSLGYLTEKGVLMNSGYDRFNARFKADYRANDWLRSYFNVGYIHSKMESNPNLSTGADAGNTAYFTQYIAPIYPFFVRKVDANGNIYVDKDKYGHPLYDFGTGYGNLVRPFLNTGNPIASNHYNSNETFRDQLQGQINFDATLTSWLSFTSTNSFNIDLLRSTYYRNPFIGSAAAENGTLYKSSDVSYRQNYVQTLKLHKTFNEKHDLQLMLGHEWYKRTAYDLSMKGRGGFSPEIKELAAFSDTYDGYSSGSTYNVEGFFANASYNYDERYFLQASFRRDASSTFAKEHRWGNFWSLGGAWLLHKEDFFQQLDATWVDNLKFKISIGQQGNDGIGSFRYTDRYTLSKGKNVMLPSFNSLGNPTITWETTTNFNLGLEFALFKGRLTGEFNVYNKKTSDLLFWVSIPESMGTRGVYSNIGDIRNTGIEAMLTGEIIRNKNFSWSISANIAHNKTKILKLDPNKTKDFGGFGQTDVNAGFNTKMWYTEGGSLYTSMLPDFAGVNEQGEPLYWVDEDIYKQVQDHELSNDDKPASKRSFTTTDWTKASYYTNEMLPLATGGFSTNLRFYNFDANLTFDYQIGGKIYDYAYASLMTPITNQTGGGNYSVDILKAWSPNNTSSNIPRFVYTDLNTTSQSTRFLASASYLNFQSFSVGYTLPKHLVSQLNMSKVRVYIQGENLGFWSARQGLDPRYSFEGASGKSGVTAYAPVRTFLGGIQVVF